MIGAKVASVAGAEFASIAEGAEGSGEVAVCEDRKAFFQRREGRDGRNAGGF
jgi:hypothetical protein